MIFPNKINLFNWCGEPRVNEVLGLFGYEHNTIVVGDLANLIYNFLSENINVMVLHSKNPDLCDYVLGLDTKSFSQR